MYEYVIIFDIINYNQIILAIWLVLDNDLLGDVLIPEFLPLW